MNNKYMFVGIEEVVMYVVDVVGGTEPAANEDKFFVPSKTLEEK